VSKRNGDDGTCHGERLRVVYRGTLAPLGGRVACRIRVPPSPQKGRSVQTASTRPMEGVRSLKIIRGRGLGVYRRASYPHSCIESRCDGAVPLF
jgi:hypothetical protein